MEIQHPRAESSVRCQDVGAATPVCSKTGSKQVHLLNDIPIMTAYKKTPFDIFLKKINFKYSMKQFLCFIGAFENSELLGVHHP